MEYLKQTKRPPGAERGLDLAGKVLTPKSERPRRTWGSLSMSVQTVRDLCSADHKCIKKEHHVGPHWPASTE